MRHRTVLAQVAATASVALLAAASHAQWSSDPATNLAIGDRPGEQTDSKLAPTADGGCYISWFDEVDVGYDLYLQRVDAEGNEMWAHNGILVADRAFTMTVQYGLDVDVAGNAVLAFRDDRAGYEAITANKVSPDGTLLWGESGVELASGATTIVSRPEIAATTDGHVVVGWDIGETDVQIQRLDGDGVPVWPEPITFTDPNGVYWLGDLQGSDNGSVIMALRRDGPMFWDPKHIWAQKISPDGDMLWGATPLVVFDAGSMQFGNFPTFITDGLGGAIFSWYNAVPLQCYVQHVSAAGEELFGHNGSVTSTDMENTRTNPSTCYDPVADETIVFWPEHWVDPITFIDYWGVYGQKFSGTGERRWTDEGVVLVPLETIERLNIHVLPCGDGAMVFWAEESGDIEYCLEGARVDCTGDPVWPGSPIMISSRFTYKLKIESTISSNGMGILAWIDGSLMEGDVIAQNVNPDGTLGPASGEPADVNGDGVVNVLDLLAVIAAWGNPGGPEDVNSDGVVDVLDLLAVIAAWG